MRKKYVIVSTYPVHGSKNIGDYLIVASTIEAIKQVKGDNVDFHEIWREDSWDNVKDIVLSSDAVIFACLAVRKDLDRVYPYLREVINSGVPFGIIAAGTRISVLGDDIFNDVSSESLELLKKAVERSRFFTTRGYLSQQFFNHHSLSVEFSGDIAFTDSRFAPKVFKAGIPIKKIAVSDPHYAPHFLKSFMKLIGSVKHRFSDSELTVLLHGINPIIEDYCLNHKVPFLKIYESPEKGLDVYDDFDLHIGFRIHGHVSALKRKKYSYLLEQDGRGNDYGLTIERKISVNSFKIESTSNRRTNGKLRSLFPVKAKAIEGVDLAAVDFLMAMIEQDSIKGFKKFEGLEDQLTSFSTKCLEALEKLP